MAVIEAPLRAEDRAEARTRTHRVPAVVAAFLALLVLVGIGMAAPVAASGGSQSDRVIAAARSHLGARYVWGSTGPHGFDCSGLVQNAFAAAGENGRTADLEGELISLFEAQNEGGDDNATSIQATFLRVTVAL